MYNPVGQFLPPPQEELEADYRMELKKQFDIVFNRLYTIINMPIARFASFLRHQKLYEHYMDLLTKSFNPHAVSGLMCRNTLNIAWVVLPEPVLPVQARLCPDFLQNPFYLSRSYALFF